MGAGLSLWRTPFFQIPTSFIPLPDPWSDRSPIEIEASFEGLYELWLLLFGE